MKEIKFSHIYPKLLDEHNDVIEEAKLIEVLIIELSELSKEFLNYDTDKGAYPLPSNGKYLMLIFQKIKENYLQSEDLFTTLRRYEDGKLKYYKNSRGEIFKIVLTDDAKGQQEVRK